MKRLHTLTALCLFICPLLCAEEKAEDGRFFRSGFILLEYYPYLEDVKSDTSLTLKTGATFDYGFSYFGFVDFFNSDGTKVGRDWDGYYSEQNVTFSPFDEVPGGLNIQWNPRTGDRNDRLRLGFILRVSDVKGLKPYFKKAHFSYTPYFHVYQFDHQSGYQWHIEHVYRWQILPDTLDDRVTLSGFADELFNESGDRHWVTKHKLALRVYDGFSLIGQYRYNTFSDADENNVALGAEYGYRF